MYMQCSYEFSYGALVYNSRPVCQSVHRSGFGKQLPPTQNSQHITQQQDPYRIEVKIRHFYAKGKITPLQQTVF
jgi:hypothetical protein